MQGTVTAPKLNSMHLMITGISRTSRLRPSTGSFTSRQQPQATDPVVDDDFIEGVGRMSEVGGVWSLPLVQALHSASRTATSPHAMSLADLEGFDCQNALPGEPLAGVKKRAGELRLLVVSSGGSASTYLVKALTGLLARFGYSLNSAVSRGEGLKHWYSYQGESALEPTCWQPDRIIYLFSEPVASILSLNRRGYLTAGSLLTQYDDWLTAHPEAYSSFLSFVASVVEQKRDLAGRQQHMEAWLAMAVPAPTLYIDTMTALTQASTLLADFLGVPGAALSSIKVQNRVTDMEVAAQGLPQAFLDVYEGVYAQMRAYDRYVRIPEGYVDPVPKAGFQELNRGSPLAVAVKL